MGILGLTHDENGTALEKLPVTIKVAIGEGPEPGNGNSHPRRLDHFVFKRKTLRGQDVVWLPAPDISEAHGEKPTALGIIFLNDDPREGFRTEYAWWTPSGCKCHGELVQIANGNGVRFQMRALRRTQKHPEGEPWPGNYKYAEGPKKGEPLEPCGNGCPDMERGDCKLSGDLYFILEKFPTFGAICRLHTSSYRSTSESASIRSINCESSVGAGHRNVHGGKPAILLDDDAPRGADGHPELSASARTFPRGKNNWPMAIPRGLTLGCLRGARLNGRRYSVNAVPLISLTPKFSCLRRRTRSVAPSAYPTRAAISSRLALLVLSRCRARWTRKLWKYESGDLPSTDSIRRANVLLLAPMAFAASSNENPCPSRARAHPSKRWTIGSECIR